MITKETLRSQWLILLKQIVSIAVGNSAKCIAISILQTLKIVSQMKLLYNFGSGRLSSRLQNFFSSASGDKTDTGKRVCSPALNTLGLVFAGRCGLLELVVHN